MVLLKALTTVLIAVGCHYLYFFLATRGVGVHHNEHFPGTCKTVPGISCGSEQIAVAKGRQNEGLAFITNGLKAMSRCNKDSTPGNIFTFDFKTPDKGVLKLKIIPIPGGTFDQDAFEPHGMDILENDVDNKIELYVVNHAKNIESVEVFEYDPNLVGTLQHVRTILDPNFICINDLTMVAKNIFYITNWMKFCRYPVRGSPQL